MRFREKKTGSLTIVWLFLVMSAACSIPNLETAECIEARPAVREFYSFHFGNEMEFSPESLRLRERFLTPELIKKLSEPGISGDPFTIGEGELPRAFRAGRCEAAGDERVTFDILMFWKDDERSEQKNVEVELKKTGDRWLIDDIKN